MTLFQKQFKADKEFPDERRSFVAPKPFLEDFVALFAVFDKDFHTYQLPKKSYPIDPSGIDSRIADSNVSVFIFDKNPESSLLQQNAWEYLVENASAVEEKLKAKLAADQAQGLALLNEEIEDGGPYEDHWKMIQSKIPNAESAIDKFFKLVAIVLDASGLDDHAFVGFEFQTAWDKDHGLEIVMHKDRVLAKAGMTELISGYGSTIEGIKGTQEAEFEPGDFKLD